MNGSIESKEKILRRRVVILTWLFIIGLFASGATAIPLRQEVHWMAHAFGWDEHARAVLTPGPLLILEVGDALDEVQRRFPFLFYGTDWLAFGHFVIAIAFIGALRDPVRNRWLFDFGLIACILVIPYAFAFGWLRGIPIWWRLIDCAFGICGFAPLWFCRKWTKELEAIKS